MLFSAGFPAGVPEYLKDCRPNLEPENRTDLRGAYKCIDIGGEREDAVFRRDSRRIVKRMT